MEPLRPPDSGSTARKRGKRTGDTRTHAGGFAQRLEAADSAVSQATAGSTDVPHADEVDADVEALLDTVHERGEELLHRRTYSSAQRYRAAIRSFLRRVVPDAVSVESVESSHDILKRKRYTLLAEVDHG